MGIEADIRLLLDAGKTTEAIDILSRRVRDTSTVPDDNLFYLLGNAYRKRGDWQQAINAYSEATALNPTSPAAEAKIMILDILNFYHKDLYNP